MNLNCPIVNFDVNEDEYLNKHVLAPQWPFRLLICGQTGSGKTNFLLNLIFHYLYYNKIYIYAKDLSEKKYEMLQNFFDEVHRKLEEKYSESIEIAYFSSDKNDIVEVDDLDKEYQNLIIIDDFVTEKDQNLIIDLFIRGRKKNTSVIYLTQSYFSTPKDIRLQCNYFAFFNISNHRQVLEIQKDHCSGVDKDTFLQYYNEATKEPFNFLMIDKKTTNKSLVYRKNLDYSFSQSAFQA